MSSAEQVGSVAALWRFPVKSMQGERVQAATVHTHGLLGDRAFALIDVENGHVVSAKSVRRFPGVLQCSAAFVAPPRAGMPLPEARITLPDGRALLTDAGDADRVLTDWFGREVRLARQAPADFTIDHYHPDPAALGPDVPDLGPGAPRDATVAGKLGAALFADLGAPSPLPAGSFLDLFPLTLLTESTLARLRQLVPGSRVDARRFRMNLVLQVAGEGFVENDWVGAAFGIGAAVRARVALQDMRCVMTTLAQGDLPDDTAVLRALAVHNRVATAFGQFPCAGVYAAVEAEGEVRVGDEVVRLGTQG